MENKAMEYRGTLSCDTLKVTAMITMLIDHIGAGILENMIRYADISAESLQMVYSINSILRLIGRISFPIYGYLLLQGLIHTRSRTKYAVNLLLFAFLSEIPFDYLFYGNITFLHQNVFWTLFIGLITLCGIEFIEKSGLPVYFQLTGIMATSAAGLLVAELLNTDYAWMGIAMILSFYFVRNNRTLQCGIAFIIFFFALTSYYSAYFPTWLDSFRYTLDSEWSLLISFLLIYQCNGQRHIKKGKYIFYAFYPIHMAVLWVVLQALL